MSNNIEILFGLEQKTIDLIVHTIAKKEKVKKIVLFGSRAKGNYKKGSDIDLALFSENLDYNELLKIKVEINGLLLPYKIDVLDFYKIKNEELKEHIERVGKIIFQRCFFC